MTPVGTLADFVLRMGGDWTQDERDLVIRLGHEMLEVEAQLGSGVAMPPGLLAELQERQANALAAAKSIAIAGKVSARKVLGEWMLARVAGLVTMLL